MARFTKFIKRAAERPSEPRQPAGNAPAATRAEDRRTSPRYPCSLERVRCSPGTGAAPSQAFTCSGTVRDISAGGIGLVLGRRFVPGTILTVELTSANKDFSRRCPLRVAYANALEHDGWLIGCTFLSRLTVDELQTLIS